MQTLSRRDAGFREAVVSLMGGSLVEAILVVVRDFTLIFEAAPRFEFLHQNMLFVGLRQRVSGSGRFTMSSGIVALALRRPRTSLGTLPPNDILHSTSLPSEPCYHLK